MSGPLDHPLVQEYLRRLDLALAGVPQPQASELRDQIAAHLDEALAPGSDDRTVAEVLDRLGPPEEIAAEMGYPPSVALDPAVADDPPSAPAVRGRRSLVPGGVAIAALVVAVVAIVGTFTWAHSPQIRAFSVSVPAALARLPAAPGAPGPPGLVIPPGLVLPPGYFYLPLPGNRNPVAIRGILRVVRRANSRWQISVVAPQRQIIIRRQVSVTH